MKRIILTACLFAIMGCQGTTGDEYRLAIFLVQNSSPDLGKIELADTPLLTDADIVSYRSQDHTLVLTDEGFSKLPSAKDVGVSGKPFLVVADGQRCYLGAFWTSFSSISHPNPVIDVAFRSQDKIVTIQRAYPSAEFAKGDDPRANKRILKALTELKKLKETPSKAIDSDKK